MCVCVCISQKFSVLVLKNSHFQWRGRGSCLWLNPSPGHWEGKNQTCKRSTLWQENVTPLWLYFAFAGCRGYWIPQVWEGPLAGARWCHFPPYANAVSAWFYFTYIFFFFHRLLLVLAVIIFPGWPHLWTHWINLPFSLIH